MRDTLATRLQPYQVTAVPPFWRERERKLTAENAHLRHEIELLSTELHTLPAWFTELERLALTAA
ncbi:MAG: hypothetical protein QOG03_2012 [Actinomycetota bacterium]|jgi:hypothetical protein|nr:hypothetical protein [Actinomycetota bacterium]